MHVQIYDHNISRIEGIPGDSPDDRRLKLWEKGEYSSVTIWPTEEQVAQIRAALDLLYPLKEVTK
jgi:hypothetical protein